LTHEQHDRAISSFKERVFGAQSVIQVEGQEFDPATEFCIVQDGSVVCSKEGTELCQLKRGESFGKLAPFGEAVCMSTVAAGIEGTRLLCVSRKEFWAAMQTVPRAVDTPLSSGVLDAKLDRLLARADTLGRDPAAVRVLQAFEIDSMAFEEACNDVNELAAASWRAIMVCKQLVSARQTTQHDNSDPSSWKLYALLKKVVRSFRARRVAEVKAEFGPHEKVVTRVQARIRGFLERRRLREDSMDAAQAGADAARRDLADLVDAELDFWDWPRVSMRLLHTWTLFQGRTAFSPVRVSRRCWSTAICGMQRRKAISLLPTVSRRSSFKKRCSTRRWANSSRLWYDSCAATVCGYADATILIATFFSLIKSRPLLRLCAASVE